MLDGFGGHDFTFKVLGDVSVLYEGLIEVHGRKNIHKSLTGQGGQPRIGDPLLSSEIHFTALASKRSHNIAITIQL